MVVLCENLDTVRSSVKDEREVAADPMLVFAVISVSKNVTLGFPRSSATCRGRVA